MRLFDVQEKHDDEGQDVDHVNTENVSDDGQANSSGSKADAPGHDDDHDHDDHDHQDHDHDSHAGDGHSEGDVGGHDDAMAHFMDPGHLFAHVQDAYEFHLPTTIVGGNGHVAIPQPLAMFKSDLDPHAGVPLIGTPERPIIKGWLSKFMVLELITALILIALFVWLARKTKTGGKPKGKLWNLLESFVVFIRDDIARPTIGKADADRFLPFLLTMFFFILGLNLFGMIPWMGSATGALAVTAVLAVITFVVVVGTGMKKMGVVGFAKAQVPHMDLPKPLAVILIPSIWAIEMFGLFVKHFVLAIRLFANMFAGHLVLAVFLAFIGATAGTMLYYFVGPAVVIGSVAIGLLELFVAFLQAYVFTFLASLFIGAAVHPH